MYLCLVDHEDCSVLIALWLLNMLLLTIDNSILCLEVSIERRSWSSYHRLINALRVSSSIETMMRVTITLGRKTLSGVFIFQCHTIFLYSMESYTILLCTALRAEENYINSYSAWRSIYFSKTSSTSMGFSP